MLLRSALTISRFVKYQNVPKKNGQILAVRCCSTVFSSQTESKLESDLHPAQEPKKLHHGQFTYDPETGFKRSKNMLGATLETPLWDATELVTVRKNFYVPHENTENRSEDEINNYRLIHNINVNSAAPKPILHFNELQVDEFIIDKIKEKNLETVTPIQAQGWPIALSGTNMVGIARTGSGKTLAYILPALVHIIQQPPISPGDGPIALVLAPTRELAQQICGVVDEFGKTVNIRATCVYGGGSKERQIANINETCEVIIATPGRLLDLLESKVLNLHRCSYLVMDEADRMLDMGFEGQIRKIAEQIRPDRQTLMWSATWPPAVQSLANEFLNNYIRLTVGSLELAANPNIEQHIKICDPCDKMNEFRKILVKIFRKDVKSGEESKILVFARTKKNVELINQYIQDCGVRSVCLHGDKTQYKRDYILKSFREDKTKILVATDVAGRGLDVNGIKYIINYDYPDITEDYVHRIGRTARRNEKGTSYTLFTPSDSRLAADLIKIMRKAHQTVGRDLIELADRFRRSGLSKNSNNRKYSSEPAPQIPKDTIIKKEKKIDDVKRNYWDEEDERF